MTAAQTPQRPMALADIADERVPLLARARGPGDRDRRDLGASPGSEKWFHTALVFLVVMLAWWLTFGVRIQ